jgi:hypothetical protein
MTKTKEQIITKIVRDLPNSNALSEMNGSEWYGWFEECWNEAINYTHCCKSDSEHLCDKYLKPELDKYKHLKIEIIRGINDI